MADHLKIELEAKEEWGTARPINGEESGNKEGLGGKPEKNKRKRIERKRFKKKKKSLKYTTGEKGFGKTEIAGKLWIGAGLTKTRAAQERTPSHIKAVSEVGYI